MPMIDVYAAEGRLKHAAEPAARDEVRRCLTRPCSGTTPPRSSTRCPPTRPERRGGQQLRSQVLTPVGVSIATSSWAWSAS
jgi:hypothetical protein